MINKTNNKINNYHNNKLKPKQIQILLFFCQNYLCFRPEKNKNLTIRINKIKYGPN